MNTTVLCICGNRPMNYMLQTVVESSIKYIGVADVFAGMRQLKINEEIDLLIVDVDNAEEECLSFIAHVKTSGFYNLPVFVLTSERTKEEMNVLNELSVDAVFFKPFSPLDLLKKADKVLFSRVVEN